jgi:hypothetical protein
LERPSAAGPARGEVGRSGIIDRCKKRLTKHGVPFEILVGSD